MLQAPEPLTEDAMNKKRSLFFETLHKVEDYFLTLLLVLMVGLAFGQIVLRKFNISLVWADPLLRHLVLLLTLLGAMVASREHNHISIDIAARFVPARIGLGIRVLCDAFAAVVCGLLTKATLMMFLDEFRHQRGGYLVDHVPLWLFQLFLPIAFCVMGLRFARYFLVGLKETLTGQDRQ